ncbi:hypothetical protein CFC21_098028 [Triticum aestivum]|uniref:Uncharacterized protein n=3 Tax=Triticum TaxID=4564 RepID=A0A9R1BPX1_TRITD|nr:hypothetical protein CFC21_098028 [Triticum aestivum]VAI75756.1 unnamed protein product [Triticum turgidum subsp. durum]
MAATASWDGGRAFTGAGAPRVDEQSIDAWRQQRVCRMTKCSRGDDGKFPRRCKAATMNCKVDRAFMEAGCCESTSKAMRHGHGNDSPFHAG